MGLPMLLACACARPPTTTPVPSSEPPTTTPTTTAVDPTPAPAPSEAIATTVSHPGCFVLLDLAGGPPLQAGDQPCDERTIPASTFKVPHALIALDTGVVTDPEAKVKWDGKKYWIDSWHRDHNLRTAIYESVVWFFQGTARAIGRERMQQYLEAFDYGNAEVTGPIDAFWLGGGSIQVSPLETAEFWAALYLDRLPRGAQHLPVLRAMLARPVASFAGRMPDGAAVPDVHPQLIFSAKTGTGRRGEGSVFWLAGHVQCPDREHVFVSRVISPNPPAADSPAVLHGLRALDELGVLKCATEPTP